MMPGFLMLAAYFRCADGDVEAEFLHVVVDQKPYEIGRVAY
jgi:hypothetical protein